MKGLTAKVFRTYNASITFQQQLDELTPRNKDASVQEKLIAYNKANRMVAILCNHQKSVSKNHAASMEKLGDKVSDFLDFLLYEMSPGMFIVSFCS
jgi:DNA topoisomerase-1